MTVLIQLVDFGHGLLIREAIKSLSSHEDSFSGVCLFKVHENTVVDQPTDKSLRRSKLLFSACEDEMQFQSCMHNRKNKPFRSVIFMLCCDAICADVSHQHKWLKRQHLF